MWIYALLFRQSFYWSPIPQRQRSTELHSEFFSLYPNPLDRGVVDRERWYSDRGFEKGALLESKGHWPRSSIHEGATLLSLLRVSRLHFSVTQATHQSLRGPYQGAVVSVLDLPYCHLLLRGKLPSSDCLFNVR